MLRSKLFSFIKMPQSKAHESRGSQNYLKDLGKKKTSANTADHFNLKIKHRSNRNREKSNILIIKVAATLEAVTFKI